MESNSYIRMVSIPTSVVGERYLLKIATSILEDQSGKKLKTSDLTISVFVYDLLNDLTTIQFFSSEDDASKFIEMLNYQR